MKRYPDKVLLAWGEAMRDNEEISKWLSSNGYAELISFILSLRGSKKADKWLFENGYPEFVALVDFLNGKEEAGQWLESHKMDVLKKLGEAVLEEEGALQWLADNGHRSLMVVSQRLKKTLEEVDFDTNDVHKSPFRS